MKQRDIFSKLIVGSRSLIFALIIAFGANVFTVQAQTIDGSLTGIVADEQGAALAGATVTITSVERNTVAATLQTNDGGTYTAISLIPGLYNIAVEKDGFSRSETRDVKIDIAQRARLDIALKIGSVSEVVTVSADSADVQLERETSSLSEVITSEQIKELPLFSRNPTNLIALAGGVSSGTDANGALNTSQLSINGSRTLNTEVTVDGVSAINGSVGDISFIPSVDALREFRVQTSAYSAEFGRSSGGTVSASVQSGGGKFSGSVYEYFRNEAFNANNYFNNSRGARAVKKPADRYNQFGFSLGGPVYGLLFGNSEKPVGKIKNTFFFFNYEGLRRTIPRQFTSTVPTDAFRGGDFSSSAVVIRDPLNGLQVRDPSRATAANPLGLNIIPLARFDPAARAIIGILPAANLGGATGNYLTTSLDKVSLNQLTTRLDHNIGTRARIYGRFSQQTGTDANFAADASQILPGALNPGTKPNEPVDRQITVGSTQNFSSTIINEFIFGLNLNNQKIDPPGVIGSPADLGFARLPQTALVPGGFVAPRIEFTGGFFGFRVGNTGRFGTNNNTLRRQNTATYQISDSLTVVAGNHTVKGGFQVRLNGLDIYNGGQVFGGGFTINGDNLPGAPVNSPETQFAAFLFGLVDSAQYQVPQPLSKRRNRNLGFFVQDDWKVTKRLTLNLGLRYEYESPITIIGDAYSRIDERTGRLLVAGVNASRSLNLKSDKKNFAPRVGFAYSLNEKTVIRAAYGIFFSQVFSNLGGSGALYPGFTQTQTFARRGAGLAQTFSLSQSFPLTLPPTVSDPFAVERAATAANPLQPGAQFASVSPLPETHQWNVGVQRQLPFGLIADASYVGTRGIFLPLDARDYNSVPLERFEETVRGNSAQATQNARPFPTVGTLNAFENIGNSIYHSGQFKITRRFRDGFGITANYTFSKSIDDGSGIFNFSQPNSLDRGYIPTFNRRLDRALSAFDRPHNLTAAVQYRLPFGKGRMFLNSPDSAAGKIARSVFGGFQINVLTSARSGLPDTITISGISTLSLSQPRPNQLAGVQLQIVNQPGANGTVQYFQVANSANFPYTPVGPLYVGAGALRRQVLPFTIGSTGRNTVRAPAQYNTDISLVRRFNLNERMNLNFRLEAFNAFNRANLIFDPAGSTTNLPVTVTGANNDQVSFAAPLFGVIDRALPARRIQLVARFEF